ncbi:nucleotide-binding domain-containing protein [Byssothecium circinans]|uniref:Nucleotide-binding domain-containing protein n=1 Tax=Byssothecium circinans TaxID=147558 RepID=A0A6A5ULB0_9PLEO|nr:nucleotide-binding domain-containing protein [Byssothecium circinans]
MEHVDDFAIDSSSDTWNGSSTPQSTIDDESPNLMEKKNVAILGAGSIGMWSAFYLAKALPLDSYNVIVVDTVGSAFGATSGTCTGCIHYGFQDVNLINLGKYSFRFWRNFAQDDEFRATTGLRFNSVFGLHEKDGEDIDLLPDWVRTGDNWKVNTEFLGTQSGVINPIGLARWLTQECEKLGVQIWTSATVNSVSLDEQNRVTSISGFREDKSEFICPCEDFILAGGPWTPSIFRTLFPFSPVHPELIIDAGDWILFQNPIANDIKDTSTAFVSLDDIVGEKLEFAGRPDGTIWVCGRSNFKDNLNAVGTSASADPKMISELTGRAYRFLKVRDTGSPATFKELKVISAGRAFRPATPSGLPTMAVLPPHQLNADREAKGVDTRGNVFLCWGHGSYGLTLGPGVGKLMSQIVLRERPDIDVSPFQPL